MRSINQESLELARGFLGCAVDDNVVSLFLLNEGYYAAAVYHQQQAVEKTLKAHMLLSGLFTRKELIKLGHNSLDAFLAFADKAATAMGVDTMRDPKARELFRQLKDEIRKDPKSLVMMDHQGISGLLSIVQKYRPGWDEFVRKHPEELGTLSGEESEGMYLSMFFLLVASVVTFPHEATTRYPDGPIKPWDYNEKTGVVQAIPEISRDLNKTLKHLLKMAGIQ